MEGILRFGFGSCLQGVIEAMSYPWVPYFWKEREGKELLWDWSAHHSPATEVTFYTGLLCSRAYSGGFRVGFVEHVAAACLCLSIGL